MKQCNVCGETKPLGDFYLHKDQRKRKNGHYAACKGCHNARTRRWLRDHPEVRREANWQRRGIEITSKEYEQRLADQGSVCAICERPCGSGNRLAVDHDHSSGEVRGLLCLSCNQSVGKIENGTTPLDRLIAYLKL